MKDVCITKREKAESQDVGGERRVGFIERLLCSLRKRADVCFFFFEKRTYHVRCVFITKREKAESEKAESEAQRGRQAAEAQVA